MLTMDATPAQKTTLAVLSGTLVFIIVFYFFLWTPYKEYRSAKSTSEDLDAKIKMAYQDIALLYDERRAYNISSASIGSSLERLYVDNAHMLDVLTQNSPIKEFSYASLVKDKTTKSKSGIVEYPFELGFQGSYKQLGEYLLYQENSVPISTIRSIDIKPSKDNPGLLITRITGTIYSVVQL
ncbi:hypothetical protein JW960_04170 [candidate division KSB1 bacterium]|nr:hypothetical protein [candidate division KSB1 bacterium]